MGGKFIVKVVQQIVDDLGEGNMNFSDGYEGGARRVRGFSMSLVIGQMRLGYHICMWWKTVKYGGMDRCDCDVGDDRFDSTDIMNELSNKIITAVRYGALPHQGKH
jgi:hypothetical protein